MGLIERLRAIPVWMVEAMERGWQTHGTTAYEAADALERLTAYAGHLATCDIMTHGVWSDPIPCTCGLSALLKEIDDADGVAGMRGDD